MASKPTVILPTLAPYRIVGPDGLSIAFTKEAFDAIHHMVRTKLAGSVILDFSNGGIAGVEQTTKKVYK